MEKDPHKKSRPRPRTAVLVWLCECDYYTPFNSTAGRKRKHSQDGTGVGQQPSSTKITQRCFFAPRGRALIPAQITFFFSIQNMSHVKSVPVQTCSTDRAWSEFPNREVPSTILKYPGYSGIRQSAPLSVLKLWYIKQNPNATATCSLHVQGCLPTTDTLRMSGDHMQNILVHQHPTSLAFPHLWPRVSGG